MDGTYLPDLLPLPMTEKALAVVCRHVEQVQAALGRRILVENPSTYVQYALSAIQAALAQLLNPANASERLDVYRNTILGACARALRLNFPTVERLVGRDFFEGAAQIFALQHCPSAPDLNAYGARFPEFLGRFEPCAGIVYLPDVARLDGAVSRALHAPDGRPLTMEGLAAVRKDDASTLRFGAHPSVSLLTADCPVDAIWHAVLEQDDAAMAAVDLASGPVHLLVERAQDQPRVVRLAPDEWTFAAALMAGEPLGSLVERFHGIEVPALLAGHVMSGRLVFAAADEGKGATP